MFPEWNEYDWEREIKRDELRIDGYFKTLPRYLDMPGEDEAIYRKLQAQKELAPAHGGNWQLPAPGRWEGDDDETDAMNEDEIAADLRSRSGFELFARAERAVREWNAVSVLTLPVEQSLHTAALYGKMLSRIYNLLELDGDDGAAGLKKALLRRIVVDAGTIAGNVREQLPDHPAIVNDAQMLRELALKYLFAVGGKN
ncbi:MAG: hypothetical protein PHI85_01875 [Victivallaceae bacterium]|nr:hypothetical protein [Victivallaceae bacterium]